MHISPATRQVLVTMAENETFCPAIWAPPEMTTALTMMM